MKNHILKYPSLGLPPSSAKVTAFNIISDKMKDDIRFYTIKEFHEAMEKLSDDVYSNKIKTDILLVATNYLLISVDTDQIY